MPSSAQIELATHKLVVNILPAYGEVDDAGAAYCTPLSLFGQLKLRNKVSSAEVCSTHVKFATYKIMDRLLLASDLLDHIDAAYYTPLCYR